MPSALDEQYMSLALRQARKAYQAGEVPIGAVVVYQGKVIGRGHNQVEARQDVTQHAEMIALRQAARHLKSWRLQACRLYVTLEPCAMCAGAMVWFRVEEIIYGAADPKAGACGSVLKVAGHKQLNHCPKIRAGIREKACQDLLREFFKQVRTRTGKKAVNKRV